MHGVVTSNIKPVEVAFRQDVLDVVPKQVSSVDQAVDGIEAVGLRLVGNICTSGGLNTIVLKTVGKTEGPGRGTFSINSADAVNWQRVVARTISGLSPGLVGHVALLVEEAKEALAVELLEVATSLVNTLTGVFAVSINVDLPINKISTLSC